MEYILTADSLCKYYRHFKALNEFSIHVPKGSIYGFIGKNGAGKTTLIRLICGLQEPTSGTYTLYGRKNTEHGIAKCRRRMGAVIETPSIYMDMTAEDNLKEQYRIIGLPSFDGITELLKLVGLENTGRKKAKNFSLGMRQRLGIAIALAGSPDFLVLDEPINGLDPQGIIEIRELILKLNREEGITFLISSHLLDELSRLATHYGFIDSGHMVKEISARELDAACRRCIRVQVSDMKALVRVLDRMEVEYTVFSDTMADIFARINVSQLTLALAEENCDIISMTEREESLESYYVNLVGGKKNEKIIVSGLCTLIEKQILLDLQYLHGRLWHLHAGHELCKLYFHGGCTAPGHNLLLLLAADLHSAVRFYQSFHWDRLQRRYNAQQTCHRTHEVRHLSLRTDHMHCRRITDVPVLPHRFSCRGASALRLFRK